MAPQLLILAAAAAAVVGGATAGRGGEALPSSNYSVILRHGSQADCPCFRIPCLVTTVDTAATATLVLLVEARWSSSECYPISGPKPPRRPPSPPALALVSSTDAVRPFPAAGHLVVLNFVPPALWACTADRTFALTGCCVARAGAKLD
jgi:hypothetical protein